ncbi:MAG TPA: hypothetical protein VGS57_02150 [Thermoanaerobaculia bacterium]|nr:hypothetical protein [Thermoanaerobaculia bacterium]
MTAPAEPRAAAAAPATTPPASGAVPNTAAAPPWFRAVVWDSLLGGLCPLLPIPFLDDLVLARMRRRMVEHLVSRWQVALAPAQLALLAAGARRGGLARFAVKAVIYPFKEMLRKILYFLAVKDAVDTFSLLFHQGYLVHAALAHGALGSGGAVDDARVASTAAAVHGTLAATNTRPLRRLLIGVLRNSRDLVRATVRWLAARLGRRRDAAPMMAAVADEGASRPELGSPEAEQLLDRLLRALWGERSYLERLEADLARRLPSR